MKEQMEARVNELKIEFEEGKKMLEELDIKRTSLGQTILRISGAIQALEELMPKENETENS
jgi:hypothetical protein